MTPYEFQLIKKGIYEAKKLEADEYQIKLKNQQDLMTIQAYQISRWVWAKKVDINKCLNHKKKNKNMSDKQMLSMAKSLNAMWGGEVIKNGTTKE